MPEISAGLVIVILAILGAEFVNGWTDAPNAIATVVSTRVMRPGQAVLMATLLNILGAAISGTAVAATIGNTINTAIMGVGASRRLSAVRWGVVGEVVAAWILTFPVCGAIGFLVALVLRHLG